MHIYCCCCCCRLILCVILTKRLVTFLQLHCATFTQCPARQSGTAALKVLIKVTLYACLCWPRHSDLGIECKKGKHSLAEQGEDRWDSGPEEGGLAKSHAARLLSELAGYGKLHPLMVHSGAAAALADRGEELVRHVPALHAVSFFPKKHSAFLTN